MPLSPVAGASASATEGNLFARRLRAKGLLRAVHWLGVTPLGGASAATSVGDAALFAAHSLRLLRDTNRADFQVSNVLHVASIVT